MIHLTDSLVLKADRYQYIVGSPKQRTDKAHEGKTVIENPQYFTSLAAALRAAVTLIMRLKVENEEITTLRDLIQEQKRLQELFAKQVDGLL